MREYKDNNKHRHSSFFENEKGMTLVDLAIAMMVIGLLITPALYQLKQYKYESVVTKTNDNFSIVSDAIDEYFKINGFYPCPADPTLARNDPNHGVSDMIGATTMCRQVPVPGTSLVAEGSIPHTELGISIDDTYDGYKNKITYAVTQALAGSRSNPLPPALPVPAGSITINDIPMVPNPANTSARICANDIPGFPGTYPPSPLPAGTTADMYPPITNPGLHFTVLSHGPDSVGAYNSLGGTPVVACTAGTTADAENCDLAADGANVVYETQRCRSNNTNTINHYDDMVTLNALKNDGLYNDISSVIAGQKGNIAAKVPLIGVNKIDPEHPLDIVGNLKTTTDTSDPSLTGTAQSNGFCNNSGSKCFKAALIGGNDPNMRCANGAAFVAIGNNKAQCKKRISDVTATSCPAGTYVRSIVSGVVTCGP